MLGCSLSPSGVLIDRKGKTVKRLFVVGVLVSVAVGAQLLVSAPAGANPDSIPICCAWNGNLVHGTLTYTISSGDATVQSWINTGVQAWPGAVNADHSVKHNLVLSPASGRTGDIDIRFKNGGGNIQGTTSWSFDSAGFISHARISISGKAFGTPNGEQLVEQITKHEMGHALGLEHADFNGDLMSTTLTNGSPNISTCDVNGVVIAQHWYLVDGSTAPAAPPQQTVTCS